MQPNLAVMRARPRQSCSGGGGISGYAARQRANNGFGRRVLSACRRADGSYRQWRALGRAMTDYMGSGWSSQGNSSRGGGHDAGAAVTPATAGVSIEPRCPFCCRLSVPLGWQAPHIERREPHRAYARANGYVRHSPPARRRGSFIGSQQAIRPACTRDPIHRGRGGHRAVLRLSDISTSVHLRAAAAWYTVCTAVPQTGLRANSIEMCRSGELADALVRSVELIRGSSPLRTFFFVPDLQCLASVFLLCLRVPEPNRSLSLIGISDQHIHGGLRQRGSSSASRHMSMPFLPGPGHQSLLLVVYLISVSEPALQHPSMISPPRDSVC